MTLKELLQKLVETEDQMERMKLVEENQDLLNCSNGEDGDNKEDWKGKYAELKAKYIQTFFSSKNDDKEDKQEDKKEDDKKEDDITIEDLFKKGDKK